MKFANVMRYDPSLKMVRLFRVEWYTGRYGEGGYATRFSVALRPAIFSFHREHEAWLYGSRCTVARSAELRRWVGLTTNSGDRRTQPFRTTA